MSSLLVNTVGTVAALCTIASFAPQVVKIARERNARAISLRTYILTCSAFTLWTTYGVLERAWPIIAANAFAGLMAASVLVMKWRFRDR